METESTSEQPSEPLRRFQFSLRQLFILCLLVSALFALTTYLKHVGFFVFCCMAGMIVGRWVRNTRLFLASLTALLVFAITLMACWVSLGYASTMHGYRYTLLRNQFWEIRDALARYAQDKGQYPDSLQELAEQEKATQPNSFVGFGELKDSWDHPYYYRKTAQGFELASLGRDGKPGGRGLDTDTYLRDDLSIPLGSRLPVSQFLFETQGSGAVFMVAVIAGIAAGSVWRNGRSELKLPPWGLVAAVVGTTIAAVVVAVFLATFHVAAANSGH